MDHIRRSVLCLCMAAALLFALCGCGTDAVVIQPGRHFDLPETAQQESSGTVSPDRQMPEWEDAEPGTASDLPYPDEAEALLDDPEFLAIAESYGGLDDPHAVAAAVLAILALRENAGEPDRALPDAAEDAEGTDEAEEPAADGRTVYWTPHGSVWHIRKNCSALSRSENIRSGTAEDARNAGMERVCKRCGS